MYAAVLAERLKEEMEGKRILPPSQAGFRKGIRITDEIYVLNYMINKSVAEGEEKMVILFIDIKTAVESVDRGILEESTRKRTVREVSGQMWGGVGKDSE